MWSSRDVNWPNPMKSFYRRGSFRFSYKYDMGNFNTVLYVQINIKTSNHSNYQKNHLILFVNNFKWTNK